MAPVSVWSTLDRDQWRLSHLENYHVVQLGLPQLPPFFLLRQASEKANNKQLLVCVWRWNMST